MAEEDNVCGYKIVVEVEVYRLKDPAASGWVNFIFLTLERLWLAAGDISCCSICFFSAAFFLVGVELLRFLRGDGVPMN